MLTGRHNRGDKWEPPEGMPTEIVKGVRAGKMCGSKKNRGGFCKSPPAARNKGKPIPRRCKLHGGHNPGAPKGNKNNLKHGVYSRALLDDDERALYETLVVNSMDDEIRMMKIRLHRALREERKQQLATNGELAKMHRPRTSESTTVEELSEEGEEVLKITTKRTRELKNAELMVHNVVHQLVKLQNQKTMMEGSGTMDPKEKVALARQFLQEAAEPLE